LGQEGDNLVARARGGDEAALEALVRAASPGVYRFILRMVRSEEDARELTQETFLRAIRNFDRYDPAYSLNTWLYRIARNLCIDRARRMSHWRRSEGDVEDGGAGVGVEGGVEEGGAQLDRVLEGERRARLERAVEALKPKYREVILLYHYEEMTYQEMAKVLGIPLGTVMNRLFRARKQLRKLLESEARGWWEEGTR